MHSRKKGQVNEKVKAEEKAKILKFDGAMRMILSQKKKGVVDIEMLKTIGTLLSKCPECLTLWNYRREIFVAYKNRIKSDQIVCDKDQNVPNSVKEQNNDRIRNAENNDAENSQISSASDEQSQKQELTDGLSKLCYDELLFIENCLKINPKAYGAWHHRVWLQTFMDESNLMREIELCNQFLKADERNFHCWDYRRIIANLSKLSPEDELIYTEKKIDENFSNFSAWHYRSSLLTKIYTSASSTSKDREFVHKTLKNDLEKIQEAIFTDPSDQSSWFYLRWIITVQNQGFINASAPMKRPLNIDPQLKQTLEDLLELEPNNKWINYILAWIEPEFKFIDKLIEVDPLRENFYRHLLATLIIVSLF